MAQSFEITVDTSDVRRAMSALMTRVARPTEAMQDIGRLLGNLAEDSFQAEKSPFGDAWPELQAKTKARRARRGHWPGQILQESGGLAASLIHDGDADGAWVGVSKVYAALHQFGGTDGMAPGPAAVPPRPYLPVDSAGRLPPGLGEQILALLRSYLAG